MAAEQYDGIGASVLVYTGENLGCRAKSGFGPTAAAVGTPPSARPALAAVVGNRLLEMIDSAEAEAGIGDG